MARHHSPRFLALVEDTKRHIREMSVGGLKAKLDNDDSFHLIDVREAEEYAAGHLPRARHLSKGIIERDIERAIPDFGAEIVLYCGGGYRSVLAADNLQRMGYRKVLSLAGGWRAWLEAGFPTVKVDQKCSL